MQIYYGVTKNDSDELTHYKYYRKYKKNGKWQYVYSQEALDENIRRINKQTSAAREKAAKYNSGYYFDKDHPGSMAAEKQQANMRYQRLKADGERALQKAAKNRVKEIEYSKSMQGKIDKAKSWLRQHKLFG